MAHISRYVAHRFGNGFSKCERYNGAMTASTRDTIRLSLADIEELAYTALRAHNTSELNARSVASSIVAAEADGIRSHGLMRLPTYCEHALSGKVNGNAVPKVDRTRSAALLADACDGFAHPAIDVGFESLLPAAKEHGIAVLGISNSYNCGVVGHHVERLAMQGCVALAYANTPAAIAPWGGNKALFGTNPIAFAAPREGSAPLVVDQSSSVVARGEVLLHSSQGKNIPEGWALDCDGKPTIDPRAALAGSMLPAGGYKGAGLALMVEILSAALTGATFSFRASSFADSKGGPPRTGQLFIAIDAGVFAGDRFTANVEQLVHEMCAQPGVRLPGSTRTVARDLATTTGVAIDSTYYDSLKRLRQRES